MAQLGDLLDLGIKGVGAYLQRQRDRETDKQLSRLSETIPQMADPFGAANRTQAANTLRRFMTGQYGPRQVPGYGQLVKEQQRQFAKAGRTYSGNAATDLARTLSREQQRYMDFLARVGGAQFSPTPGADLYSQIVASQLQNQRRRDAGWLDFAGDAADLFKGGSSLLDFFSGDGGGIGGIFKNILGGGGTSGFADPAATAEAILGGGGAAAGEGGFLSNLFGGGGAGLNTLLGIGAPLLVGSLIGGLGQSPGGAYNPVTGQASRPGDPFPGIGENGLLRTPSSSISGFISPGGEFGLDRYFEGGEGDELGSPITINNPRIGAQQVPGYGQVYIPDELLAGALGPHMFRTEDVSPGGG